MREHKSELSAECQKEFGKGRHKGYKDYQHNTKKNPSEIDRRGFLVICPDYPFPFNLGESVMIQGQTPFDLLT